MNHPLHGYTVHPKEVRDEARTWDEQSGNLARVVREGDSLRIDRVAAGVFQAIVTSYGPLLNQVMDKCREGQQNMEEIAKALREVAAGYEKVESEGERLFGARF